MATSRKKEILWAGAKLAVFAALILLQIPFAVVFVLVGLAVEILLRTLRWSDIGLQKPSRIPAVLLGGFVSAAAYQLAAIRILLPFLASVTGKPIDLQSVIALRGNPWNLVAALVVSWTFAAFGEEILYRGYLYFLAGRLLRNSTTARVVGVIFCSFLFAIGHGYQGVSGMIENFIFGFLLGAVFEMAGKDLWYPIAIHGFEDTIGFALIFLGLYP
jgi:membrane protease YdiL (CAAX protease family)